MISMIAALGARTRAIGKDNDLLWKGLKPDMKRFKTLTIGHPVIMGRKTLESLPPNYRPLPGRVNIVLSRAKACDRSLMVSAHNIEEALYNAERCPGSEEIFVIGGSEIYAQFMPYADRLYLTLVESDAEGETFFPDYGDFRKVIESVEVDWDPKMTFMTLERA